MNTLVLHSYLSTYVWIVFRIYAFNFLAITLIISAKSSASF